MAKTAAKKKIVRNLRKKQAEREETARRLKAPRYSWERIPPSDGKQAEPVEAYACARVYFEMGADRGNAAVAEATGKTVSQISSWSQRWDWPLRAADFDSMWAKARMQRELEQQDVIVADINKWQSRQTDTREEFFNYGKLCVDLAQQMLKWPIQKTERQTNANGELVTVVFMPNKWTTQSAVSLMQLGVELKRLAVGIVPGSDPVAELLQQNGANLPRAVLEAIAEGRPVAIDVDSIPEPERNGTNGSS